MKTIYSYLDSITIEEQKNRMETIFKWLGEQYPQLEGVIKWNQPMFTDHGTFIIGFSMAKHHMSFTPEEHVIQLFSKDIKAAGYEHTKGLAKIKWTDDVDYELLKKLIDYNMVDKADCRTFFRS